MTIKNRTQFTKTLNTLSSVKKNYTALAVYAIEQAATHGNLKEVTELYNHSHFVKSDGSLSAEGKRLQSYIQAQYKGLKLAHDNAAMIVEFSAKIDTTRRHMIIDLKATSELDNDTVYANGELIGAYVYQSKALYTSDFSKWMDYATFENLSKPAKEETIRQVNAKTMLTNVLALLDNGAVIKGDYKTLLDLSDKLADFKLLLDNAAIREQSGVDLAALAQTMSVPASSKSRAAH